jgi:glycosyltransferase involved in cell wall biosynthesis
VNEAMASGLPVLVSDRCGCAGDLVRNGINGFTFDPHNVEELSKLMVDLSRPETDLVAMGQASQEIISQWSPGRFAEGLAQAVDAAIRLPRTGANVLDGLLLRSLLKRQSRNGRSI